MDIYFEEDDLWVLVTQHVESWSYSDTWPAPEEAEESMFVNPQVYPLKRN